MPTIAALLRAAQVQLEPYSATPRLDAELLLTHLLGWPRARLLAERDYPVTPELAERFAALAARRATGEPVAYLVGHKEFYGLDLLVDRRVLVPRPETELLVELALGLAPTIAARRAPQALQIADIGTGSGAIAIALASNLPHVEIYAVDLSADALALAAANLERHGLAGRVRLLSGDLLAPLPGPVDMIVSNPPYTVLAEVDPEVRAHEPHLALEGGPDGAAIYRRLLAQSRAYLRPGGALLLEIGAWQGQLVADLALAQFPTVTPQIARDLAGRDRVVIVAPLP
jgi:release factor glutamine methyltransferase